MALVTPGDSCMTPAGNQWEFLNPLRCWGRCLGVSESWYLLFEDWFWFIELVKVARDAGFHQN